MKKMGVQNATIMMHTTLVSIIVFLSNLIPIIGPSLASRSIGFNEFRLNTSGKITRKLLITSIILGHAIFFLCLGLLLNFCVDFAYQQYSWLIIGLGLIGNLAFSIIFYFVGVSIYKKRYRKGQLGWKGKK
jgi:hypothetical protein